MRKPESRALPRCFAAIDERDAIELDADERHHLLHVLRVRAGEPVEVVDRGRLALAEVARAGRRELELRFVRWLEPPSFGAVPIRLGCAVLHPPAMDRLVRLAAELHAARLCPVLSERTQHRDVSAGTLERWRRIAREACKQARRVEVPALEPACTLREWLEQPPPARTLRLCLAPEGAALTAIEGAAAAPQAEAPREIWLLQGPEGGWSPVELEAVAAAGVPLWSLGRAVFRAETCPLVALVLLHQRFGELLRPGSLTPRSTLTPTPLPPGGEE